MDLGFEKAGFEIDFVNEIHKPFLEAYKSSRKNLRINEPKYGYHFGNIEDLLLTNQDLIKNAIKDATGTRLYNTPMNPRKILEVIDHG